MVAQLQLQDKYMPCLQLSYADMQTYLNRGCSVSGPYPTKQDCEIFCSLPICCGMKCGDPGDPGGADVHVWPVRRRPAAGMGSVRGGHGHPGDERRRLHAAGGAISGKSEIGKLKSASVPASVIRIERTRNAARRHCPLPISLLIPFTHRT